MNCSFCGSDQTTYPVNGFDDLRACEPCGREHDAERHHVGGGMELINGAWNLTINTVSVGYCQECGAPCAANAKRCRPCAYLRRLAYFRQFKRIKLPENKKVLGW